jgi:hypothetical protein
VSEPQYDFIPYKITYSERVRAELKSALVSARARGRLAFAAGAARKIDYLLQTYPQAGEPIKDLAMKGNVLWALGVDPFFVQYVLNEGQRLVLVVKPFRVAPDAGF